MEALRAWTRLIVIAALASTLPPVRGQAGPQVVDPADDARENDSASTADLARRTACRVDIATSFERDCTAGNVKPL